MLSFDGFNLFATGMANAIVFPEPVGASNNVAGEFVRDISTCISLSISMPKRDFRMFMISLSVMFKNN